MSDAGTMIIIRRHDKANLTEHDRLQIETVIRAMQSRNQHYDATNELFRFRIGDSHPVGSGVFVLLSEYWGEGLDDGFYGVDSFEPLLEKDKQGADSVFKCLQNELGAEYALEFNSGSW